MTHSRIPQLFLLATLALLIADSSLPTFAQQAPATNAVVPPLVRFSGVLTDGNGKPISAVTGVTFALYTSEQGGAPLWLETQNVYPDKTGHYTVLLGSTTSTGLPADLFAAGEARWLAIQVEGQAEQPRITLVSVPYALKSGDAETIGGLPPSAFVRATPDAASSGNGSGAMTSSVSNTRSSAGTLNVNGKTASSAAVETQNYVAKFVNGTGGLGNSLIFDNGTNVGIGTATPADALDVVGSAHIDFNDKNTGNSAPNLAFGDGTSGEGISSTRGSGTINKYGLDFWTYKQRRMSITSTGSVGIGTATPTDALDVVGGAHFDFTDQNNGSFGTNLAFGDSTSGEGISSARQGTTNKWGLDFWTYHQRRMSITSMGNVGVGTATPAAMLEVNGTAKFDDLVSFASGQTFPGTGTITGVMAGADLTGGGNSGNVTLNLDTTKVPLLNAANTFTGSQTVNGDLIAAGTVHGNAFWIGNIPFDFGSYTNGSVFLGFAGNPPSFPPADTGVGFEALAMDMGGGNNTAIGYSALLNNETGTGNTASGYQALWNNETGVGNTASGYQALYNNGTGSYNAALGYLAGQTADNTFLTTNNDTAVGAGAEFSTGSLSNATAIGSNSEVAENNALVLGAITGVNSGTSVNVGIGTTKPMSTLDVDASVSRGLGPTITLTNLGGNPGSAASIDFNSYTPSTTGTYNPGARIEALDDDYADDLYFQSNVKGAANQGLQTNVVFLANGQVGIGTTAPDSTLSVNGSADKSGGGSWGTFSDRRLKNLDGRFRSGLSQIMQINPVLYRYKEDNAMGIRDRDEHVGLVAQDVQKVIPEAVTESSKGYLLVNNDPIIWTMLNAIKEQQQQIRELKSELRATRQTLQKVKAQVAAVQPALVAKK